MSMTHGFRPYLAGGTACAKCDRYVRMVLEELSKPCSDCGREFPYYIMEFDHARGVKSFNIGRTPHVGMKRLRAEIAKCDVVCANCHNIRTHERRNNAPEPRG